MTEKAVGLQERAELCPVQNGSCSKDCNCGALTREDETQVKSGLVSVLPGAVLFALALVLELSGSVSNSLILILFVLSYVLVGGDIVLKAVRNLIRLEPFDEFFLMTLATLGAFAVGALPEAVAVMLFFKVGELFQEGAVSRAKKSITSLIALRPDFARVMTESGLDEVDPGRVEEGQRIEVRPGERVPLDGTVFAGSGDVDASALTGESRPRRIGPGEDILSGMISTSARFEIQVTRPLAESTVQRILDLVQDASLRKAPTERFITRFARVYTPAVVLLALVIAFGPWMVSKVLGGTALFGAQVDLAGWVYRGLIFLVVSCPCALVISIPLGFFGGIGAASRQGILVKGGHFLEGLNRLTTVVWDKTGTLTRGRFSVAELLPSEASDRDGLLEAAALAESRSSHPIAESIRRARPIEDLPEVEEYTESPGLGVLARIDAVSYAAGNTAFMESLNVPVHSDRHFGTVVHVARDKEYLGAVIISDEVKPGAAEAVQALRHAGVTAQVMLTGDSEAMARSVAEALGLDRISAGLLPQDKVSELERIMSANGAGGKTAFIGDGINDAPVLARADIGVAMGGLGSDAAIEAADVVLMEDKPEKMVQAIRVARRTRTIVWQNIGLALGVKLCVLGLGAFGLATMWQAVFADVGVALLAVLNALRINSFHPGAWMK